MNALFDWLTQPLPQRVGWTLLHFLWQGALLALLHQLARAALHRRSANARYAAGCLTLLLMAIAPVWTFVKLDPQVPQPHWTAGSTVATPLEPTRFLSPVTSPIAANTNNSGVAPALTSLASASVPWLTLFWMAGVVALSLRLSAGWWRVRGWEHDGTSDLDATLQTRLNDIQERLGVKRGVRLLRSAVVRVPTLVGWFRPVILLPASTLTGLTPHQLDFILAHELAHVRRGDAWVNLFQTVVEVALFYHPAVWWVSRRVREEREHCCDDLALAVCGDRLVGAQALATIEELRQWSGGFALAANDGSLLTRVRRLLGVAEGRREPRQGLGAALVGLGLAAVLAGAVGFVTLSKAVYTARTRLLFRDRDTRLASAADPSAEGYDPYRVASEAELVRGFDALREVVVKLRLDEHWMEDSPLGKERSLDEAAARLSRCVEVRQMRNPRVLEIGVTLGEPRLSADVANALVETYLHRRTAAENRGLVLLEESLQKQTEALQKSQQDVDQLRDALGAIETSADQPTLRESLEREKAVAITQQLSAAQGEDVAHQTQLAELRKLDPTMLRRALPTVVPNEVVLPSLLQDLAAAEREQAKLRLEFTAEHPAVRRIVAAREELDRQVRERLDGIMTGLEQTARSQASRREELQRSLEETTKRLLEDARQRRELGIREQALKRAQDGVEALRLRLAQEKVDLQLRTPAAVSVLDRAEPPLRSSGSQGPGWTRLAMGGGCVLLLLGWVMRMLPARWFHSGPGNAGSQRPASATA